MIQSVSPTPEQVLREYEQGTTYKASLGTHGLYEQSRINQRFFLGDQWHGVSCGDDRPLVRHNLIKRIGNYKMAVVGSAALDVSYSAEGIPNTVSLQESAHTLRKELAKMNSGAAEKRLEELQPVDEINLVMGALTDYFRTTAGRLGFETVKQKALMNAYESGTAVVYTYWDPEVHTGLYADTKQKVPLSGDIACEVLDIQNVTFGDPACEDVQKQPYILIAQRRPVEELQREAALCHRPQQEIASLHGDLSHMALSDDTPLDPESLDKATVITRLWKERDAQSGQMLVKAIKTCCGMVVRPMWDLGIRLYPLAVFPWERRPNCAYGESEITNLIPNQIAVNRMMTAAVWAAMAMGMPMMVVNGDVVTQPVTNDPGQIIQVFGTGEDVNNAIRYVTPPAFSTQFDSLISSLIDNTLAQAGATKSALGDMNPDNTSAIRSLREAANLPMQLVQNRFYTFVADIARIWAEYWLIQYGKRLLSLISFRMRCLR